jgi:hypothetical protein
LFEDKLLFRVKPRPSGWSYIYRSHIPTQVRSNITPLHQPHNEAIWAFALNLDQILDLMSE